MSKVENLDPALRFLVALSAKIATLGILAKRFSSSIAVDQKNDVEDPTDHAALASEQHVASILAAETVASSSAWLGRVCRHHGVDILALPDDVQPGPFANDVDPASHFDIAFELVLASIGLTEAPQGATTGSVDSEKKGKEKERKEAMVYSALDRTLVVRTASGLGVSLKTVEDAEKSIAQFLYFQLSEEEGGPKADGGSNGWDEAAQEEKEKAAKKGKMLKWAATGAGFVLGGVAIGLTGGLAAPALAPFLVGGLGIAAFSGAGGAILIGTLLGLGGGGLAGYRAHSRLKGLEELAFEQLKKPDVPSIPSLTATICCSGFLLDLEDSVSPWRPSFEKSNLDTFALKVDTATFLSAGRSLDKYLRNKVLQMGGQEILKTTALSALYAGVALPLAIFSGASTVLDSDFSRCRDKARKAGILLAEILEKKVQGSRPVILVGYGPGATIIFEALLELHRRELGSLVYIAILISLPSSPNAVKWASARSVVSNRLVNCHSTNDWVLAIAARLYTLSASVAGMQPVSAEGVENVDCSDLVTGHLELRGKITEILERVKAQGSV
ncbi:hypothetical protein P7C70_g5613, partial [Phenoliferia sp. Uapishka_3]